MTNALEHTPCTHAASTPAPDGAGAPIPMELLAPAGGWEQLRAAVLFGADAVYLAADRFGMRARAANFPLQDIPAAVEYAHAHGVKVHVTCNVMMTGEDLDLLPAFFRAIDAAGVDALIIGDLGAFSLARQHAPHVQLHVSTQASVMNAEAARMWYQLGATRVVCAREMSLADIARLRADAPPQLEIEAFVHGAMCMAYSGRCLISSFLTGRSANKGHCTQPCRWQYDVHADELAADELAADELVAGEQLAARNNRPAVSAQLEEEKRPGQIFDVEEDGRGTFIMNARDLNMLCHLRKLCEAGVDSIKIEGRNKKAFYVASVVNAYRRVLDGEDSAAVAPELFTVSHRPYGTGFYFGPAYQAPDYDGYEQNCMHVADVVSCQPAAPAPACACAVEAAELAACTAAPAPATPAEPAEAPSEYVITVRCRNRFAEGDQLEALIPGKPAQPVEVRKLVWVPEQLDSKGAPIEEASTLAALEAGNIAPQAAEVANRSTAIYQFASDAPVPAGSYLRVCEFRRSARHA